MSGVRLGRFSLISDSGGLDNRRLIVVFPTEKAQMCTAILHRAGMNWSVSRALVEYPTTAPAAHFQDSLYSILCTIAARASLPLSPPPLCLPLALSRSVGDVRSLRHSAILSVEAAHGLASDQSISAFAGESSPFPWESHHT
jgi:hypothetical protein